MLEVNIDKILPVTSVRDSLNKIIDEVEGSDELYVVTKNGVPAAIVVGVHHLEKLTGIKHEELMPDEEKKINDADSSTDTVDNTPDNNFGLNASATTDTTPLAGTTPPPTTPATEIPAPAADDATATNSTQFSPINTNDIFKPIDFGDSANKATGSAPATSTTPAEPASTGSTPLDTPAQTPAAPLTPQTDPMQPTPPPATPIETAGTDSATSTTPNSGNQTGQSL